VALQQHADIIAANAAAKAAGVTKHCSPDRARALLKAAGGLVAYVNVEDGGRISYKPYREASAEFFALLERMDLASVVEKGSIDEAYILCRIETTRGESSPFQRGCVLLLRAVMGVSEMPSTQHRRVRMPSVGRHHDTCAHAAFNDSYKRSC
jgi:nucleotidyltransferase/DNA polymerase involved in DNA repair